LASAVIFDLDGVIADTHPYHTRAWRQLLSENGKRASDEELQIIREGRKRNEILQSFFKDLPAEDAARLSARKEQLFQESCDEIKSCSGLAEFLDQLEEARVPKSVATSASKLRALDLLSRLNLTRRFIAVVTADDVSRGKPDPSIFLLAAKYLCVPPSEILVIEDSTAGVRGAKSAGMKCVGLSPKEHAQRLYNAGADHVIQCFSEATWSVLCGLLRVKTKTEESRVGFN
jgi:beta-phosphoglucomutase